MNAVAWSLFGLLATIVVGLIGLAGVGVTWIRDSFGGLHAETGDFRIEMRGEIGSLRGEMGGLRGEMGGLRGEMREEMGGLRGEMREEMGGLRGEMTQGFAAVNARFDSVNGRLDAMSSRLDDMNARLDTTNALVAGHETRLRALEGR